MGSFEQLTLRLRSGHRSLKESVSRKKKMKSIVFGRAGYLLGLAHWWAGTGTKGTTGGRSGKIGPLCSDSWLLGWLSWTETLTLRPW